MSDAFAARNPSPHAPSEFPNAGPTLLEHLVTQGERLDNVTAKYLNDPTQFWRVADANQASRPEELTDEIGRRIVISLPQ